MPTGSRGDHGSSTPTYGVNLPLVPGSTSCWLGNLARGTLGFSWTLNQSVASLMLHRIGRRPSPLVGLSTLLAAVWWRIPIGHLFQAVRPQQVHRPRAQPRPLNISNANAGTSLIGQSFRILLFALIISEYSPPEALQAKACRPPICSRNFNAAVILPICCLSLDHDRRWFSRLYAVLRCKKENWTTSPRLPPHRRPRRGPRAAGC